MAEPAHVMWLLAAISVTAAVFTGLGWTLARRKRRRGRQIFVAGVLFGMLAGPVLQRRRRHLRALRAATRGADRMLRLTDLRQSSRR